MPTKSKFTTKTVTRGYTDDYGNIFPATFRFDTYNLQLRT